MSDFVTVTTTTDSLAQARRLAAAAVEVLARPLLEFLKERHSYQTPELLVTPIVTGHQDYLDWIEAETQAR
jgi:periplasmic divalent cation tolerance protein